MIIFSSSYFLGVLWLIFVCDIQTQPKVVLDKFDSPVLDDDGNKMFDGDENFCTGYMIDVTTNFEKLVKVWYYAITTLSTIGYGDMSP